MARRGGSAGVSAPPRTAATAARLAAVQAALDRLRRADTVRDLVALAPREVAGLGFDRCLISRLHDATWIARAAYARDDVGTGLADAVVAAGSAIPWPVDHRLIESELVRRRVPLLVTDPQNNVGVHPELNRVARPVAYVAAPIVAGPNVVGFLHADIRPGGRAVDAVDREILMIFATGLGLLLERIHYQRLLSGLHEQLRSVIDDEPDLLDEAIQAASHRRPRVTALRTDATQSLAPAGRVAGLTRRELEVVTRLAAGETNRQIAAALFIAETTVKAHVKHILRKLGAANRAEAVSWFLRGR